VSAPLARRLAALELASVKTMPALFLFLHRGGKEGAEPLSIEGFERLPLETWDDYRERAKRHHGQQPGHIHVLMVRYRDDDQ